MTSVERDALIEIANLIDEASREMVYVSMATPTIDKCRERASEALKHLSQAEENLKAIGVPIVENPQGML